MWGGVTKTHCSGFVGDINYIVSSLRGIISLKSLQVHHTFIRPPFFQFVYIEFLVDTYNYFFLVYLFWEHNVLYFGYTEVVGVFRQTSTRDPKASLLFIYHGRRVNTICLLVFLTDGVRSRTTPTLLFLRRSYSMSFCHNDPITKRSYRFSVEDTLVRSGPECFVFTKPVSNLLSTLPTGLHFLVHRPVTWGETPPGYHLSRGRGILPVVDRVPSGGSVFTGGRRH